MSQNIYLSHSETELWSCGGRIYRSLSSARRYRQGINHWNDKKQKFMPYPIYKIDLTWTEVPDEEV
jgi:hypothetical protein